MKAPDMEKLRALQFEDAVDGYCFASVVGSHMWGTNTLTSDVDYFVCYMAPTNDILKGVADRGSRCINMEATSSNPKTDFSFHEIGHVIDQLIKGNVNFLWGMFSPMGIQSAIFDYRGLSDLAEKSLSKSCARSIYGMSKHNYEKYIRDKKLSEKELEKKCNTVVRTLKFGERILKGKGISFEPSSNNTLATVEYEMDKFLEAEEKSLLPANCPNEEDLRCWLLCERLNLAGYDF